MIFLGNELIYSVVLNTEQVKRMKPWNFAIMIYSKASDIRYSKDKKLWRVSIALHNLGNLKFYLLYLGSKNLSKPAFSFLLPR